MSIQLGSSKVASKLSETLGRERWSQFPRVSFGLSVNFPSSKAIAAPLNRVRDIIRFIFTNAMTLDTEYVFIINSHEPTTVAPSNLYPVWYIRVHHPILTSPDGVPMVILSAADEYLSYNLHLKGRLNLSKSLKLSIELSFRKAKNVTL